MLKEIHHRVKNNLQVISSLLDLHAQHFSDRLIRAVFTDSQHRIRLMALIHEQLFRSTDLARIDMVQYIQDLALSLLNSYGKVADDIALQTDIAVAELDVDQAMPYGLIVNELVTNALTICLRRHWQRRALYRPWDGKGGRAGDYSAR